MNCALVFHPKAVRARLQHGNVTVPTVPANAPSANVEDILLLPDPWFQRHIAAWNLFAHEFNGKKVLDQIPYVSSAAGLTISKITPASIPPVPGPDDNRWKMYSQVSATTDPVAAAAAHGFILHYECDPTYRIPNLPAPPADAYRSTDFPTFYRYYSDDHNPTVYYSSYIG